MSSWYELAFYNPLKMRAPALPTACTFHSYGLNTWPKCLSTLVYNRGLALP